MQSPQNSSEPTQVDPNNTMTVLVTGYRNWPEPLIVYNALESVQSEHQGKPLVLVHGDCPTGADAQAHDHAINFPDVWSVKRYPADWKTHGKAAGPIRNQQMIDDMKPQIALVFLHPDSRGTVDCLQRLQKMNPRPDIRIFRC